MPCDGFCYRPVNGLESTFGLSWRYPLNKTIWQKMNKAAVAERFKRHHFVDINIVFSLWNFVCSVAYSFQPPQDFNVHMGPSSFLPLSEKTRCPRHWHLTLQKNTALNTVFICKNPQHPHLEFNHICWISKAEAIPLYNSTPYRNPKVV